MVEELDDVLLVLAVGELEAALETGLARLLEDLLDVVIEVRDAVADLTTSGGDGLGREVEGFGSVLDVAEVMVCLWKKRTD